MQISSNEQNRSKAPKNVFVIEKIDTGLVNPFIECISWLTHAKNLKVFVQLSVLSENLENFKEIANKVQVFTRASTIDLVVCLGGDGTLLYSASLFQRNIPPIDRSYPFTWNLWVL